METTYPTQRSRRNSLTPRPVSASAGARLMSACPTCGVDPCANPSFCSTCRDADRRRARGERPRYVSEWHDWPAAPERHPRPTPEVTIEAMMYCVRERGVQALREAANIERLGRCDAAAKAQANVRIAKSIKGTSGNG